jgi:short subunit dehydrogenase-like uncharacterized protein
MAVATYDVVLLGATGFTGSLVAEYLARNGGSQRLALAGRDVKKLEALKARLGRDFPLLQVNTDDAASLERMVQATEVVCSTVGPYALNGSGVVAACVRNGKSYCDLAGEPQWIRRMIDAHHEQARTTGARIVHCCGFDSVPSDLGTWTLQEFARRHHGAPASEMTFAVLAFKGGLSGGTFASMLELVHEAKNDSAVRQVLRDPYSLVPGGAGGPDKPGSTPVGFDARLGRWTAPFMMAVVNERVVRRTNALAGYPYGRAFHYQELMTFRKGPKGLLLAHGMTNALRAFLVAGGIRPVRELLEKRVLPKPGQGPSAELREKGFFSIALLGQGTDSQGRKFQVRGKVAAQGDPGYSATAKMLGESALCLALDGPQGEGGVLTPAVAMGDRLTARLRRQGFTFEAETAHSGA